LSDLTDTPLARLDNSNPAVQAQIKQRKPPEWAAFFVYQPNSQPR
jgi:hypothetical protein